MPPDSLGWRQRKGELDSSVLLRVVLDEPNQVSEWDAFEDPLMSTLVEVEGPTSALSFRTSCSYWGAARR